MATRSDLAEARSHIGQARAGLADGDVETAKEELATSRNVISRADGRTNRLLWRVGQRVPVAGRSLRAVDGIVDVAEAAARVGREVVDRSSGILGPGGEVEVQVTDGRVELEPVEMAGAALEQLDLGPLERAHAKLESGPSDLLVGEVAEARRETLALSRSVLGTVERGRTLLAVLPDFLGAEGPRRYFIAMQNNGELRGTGGLIGYYAILTADDGQLGISEPAAPGILRAGRDEPAGPLTPVGTNEEYRDRYQHVNAAGFFSNVNVDPDLPTTGRVVTSLYETRTGEGIDGVVALDPVGLGTIMDAIGPVPVPEGLATGDNGTIPTPIDPEDIPRTIMIDVYDVLGSGQDQNEAFFQAVAVSAFEQIVSGGWDAVAVSRRIAEASGGRHLQLFSEHAEEQEAFELLGVAGAMTRPWPSDVLAVTANNAVGGKMDVHVGHEVTGRIALRRSAVEDGFRRSTSLEVGLQNPLAPDDHDIYITGSIPTYDGQRYSFEDGEPALNRTWFTVWAPETTALLEARDASGEKVNVGLGTIHGHRAVDRYLETPSRSENHFEVDLTGPVQLEADGGDLVYRLTVWRQAKAIPDRLDLSVVGLEGWDIAEASVRGGGDGSGMGVFGEPGPEVDLEVDGDRVHVTGDVTTDLHLEIRFSKPWRDRLLDWLRQPAF